MLIKFRKGNFAFIFIVFYFLRVSLNFFGFIYKNTTHVPFWDQWTVFDVVLFENNPLKIILHQHNEHRMGVAIMFMKIFAYLSHWNSLWETMFSGLLILLSSVLALHIKVKVFRSLSVFDLIIPFVFLNLYQFENITLGFQIGFVLPLFWLMLALFFTTLKQSVFRNTSLVLVSLLSAYSHFHGLFVTLIIGGFFLLEMQGRKHQARKENFLLFISTLLVLISYFIGYDNSLSFLGRHLPRFDNMLEFALLELAAFLGSDLIFISIFVIAFVGLSVFVIKKRTKNKLDIRDLIVLALYAYSLAFMAINAFGRSILGLEFAATSRYITHFIPLFLGIYFFILSLKIVFLRNLVATLFILFVVSFSLLNIGVYETKTNFFKRAMADWESCYRKTNVLDVCGTERIYPFWREIRMQEKLEYLKEQRLSLFSSL